MAEPPPVVVCCGSLQIRIQEAGPLWCWEILKAGEVIQEGASISLSAAYRDGQKIARVLDR